MKCQISCSFGEVVDKVTILQIKQKKISDESALQNITNELDKIKREIPLVNEPDDLFTELYKINMKLWILEDVIRAKSAQKTFDQRYINCAESIHSTNDERYQIKRKINLKYKSELVEEKGYNVASIVQTFEVADQNKMEEGKHLYTIGKYAESYQILQKIMHKYANYTKRDSVYIDLLFSYQNIVSMFNIQNPYFNKIQAVMSNIDHIPISDTQKDFAKTHYATYCLHNNDYESAQPYLNQLNRVSRGPEINYTNMSFFSDTDRDKTLILYDGGGIGDKVMLARLIPILCERYSTNHIVFFVDDRLGYLFRGAFSFKNLTISQYSHYYAGWDYHCSLLSLLKYLNIGYNDITFTPLFKNIPTNCKYYKRYDRSKRRIVLNWKGNPKNSHEKHNRRMDLKCAIPLFKIPGIEWIVLTSPITDEEDVILKQYDVINANWVDNARGVGHYEKSMDIIKQSDAVISTDTSLVHVSANLGVKTYVLLTLGCEWRWSPDHETTRWYPDAVLLRQTKIGDWSDVITKLENHLTLDEEQN